MTSTVEELPVDVIKTPPERERVFLYKDASFAVCDPIDVVREMPMDGPGVCVLCEASPPVSPSKFCTDCHVRRKRLQGKLSALRRYGLTAGQFVRMLRSQSYRCAVCGMETDLHIDHDHRTGAVRELLCGKCNRGLGCADDSPYILRKMADYLERHRDK